MLANRWIQITEVQKDILITIEKEGEIASWVSSPDQVLLEKGRSTNITFTLAVPEDAPYGNLTGTVRLTLRKV